MKELRAQHKIISRLLGDQPVSAEKTYRPLTFCKLVDVDGETVVFNALTGVFAELTEEESSILRQERVAASAETEPLIKKWFLVPAEHDDIGLADEVRTLAGDLQIHKHGELTDFTIFTTTDCNARCFYCYELGAKRMLMSEQVARDTADFILRRHGGKPVNLIWFGGEPLYNAGVIDIISAALRDAGVSYKAKMISNGYLFDGALAEKASSLWNLSNVQITLDGTEEVYNKAKAYIYKDGRSPFKVVTDNIEGLLARKISVNIRMNMGAHNKEDLYRLVDWLDAHYPDKTCLHIYPHLLFDCENEPPEAKKRDTEQVIALERYCEAKGVYPVQRIKPRVAISYCMMDSASAVTILPDGKLGKCEHHVADKPIGDIYHGITDTAAASMARRGTCRAVCDGCPAYPVCNKLENCPLLFKTFCDEADRYYADLWFERSIRETYRDLKKNVRDQQENADADSDVNC